MTLELAEPPVVGVVKTPTHAQLLVLALLAQGLTYEQTAMVLHRSFRTVQNQAKAVRERLGAYTTPHAVTIAFHHGWFG